MSGRYRLFLIGLFALVTALTGGLALGRWIGLSIADSLYATLLVLAVIGWWIGRRR